MTLCTMTQSAATTAKYSWETFRQLPWPNNDDFKTAKAAIELDARGLNDIEDQTARVQAGEKLAHKFVEDSKEWLPEELQEWTKGCVMRQMIQVIHSLNIKEKERGIKKELPQENNHTQGDVVDDVVPGDGDHGTEAVEPPVTPFMTSYPSDTQGNIPSAVGSNLSPGNLQTYIIRLDKLADRERTTLKRVALWLCCDPGSVPKVMQSSFTDIGMLSFRRLKQYARPSVSEIIVYQTIGDSTGFVEIQDDEDFATAIQTLAGNVLPLTGDLIIYVMQRDGMCFFLHVYNLC